MPDDSEITFRGPGPFHLPVAQRATAIGRSGDAVTMTVYVILPERGPEPEPVSAQMIPKVARELSVQLLQAASEAEEG